MGVQGLWKLLEPAGKPVTLESLQGKILAVDLSIWIHQAIRGCAGRANEKNAHLIVLFHRILKLLFYGVRPIFVFDGPNVPQFKRHTLSKRRMKQDEAAQKLSKIQKKILKYLAAEAISDQKLQLKKDDEEVGNRKIGISPKNNQIFDDLPLVSSETLKDLLDVDEESSSDKEDFADIDVPANLDMESDQFSSLPSTLQHDILLNLRENARFIRKKVQLPEDSNDFSNYQLKNLLKKGRINLKLEQVQKNMAACDPTLSMMKERGEFKVKNVFHGDRRRHIILETAPPVNQNSVETIENLNEICTNSVQNNSDSDRVQPILNIAPDHQSIVDGKSMHKSSPAHHEAAEGVTIILNDGPSSSQINLYSQESSEPKNYSEIQEKGELFKTTNKESHISQINSELRSNKTEIELETANVESQPHSNGFQDSELLKRNQFNEDMDSLPCTSSASSCQIQIHNPQQLDQSDDDDSFVEVEEIPAILIQTDDFDLDSSTFSSQDNLFDIKNESFEENTNLIHKANVEENAPEESLEELLIQRRKAESIEKTLNSQILEECESLLKLFGIPVVQAPGEAEAQCAAIECQGLTSGTITDDSDVWLFGGKCVYRHVFDKRQFVKKYESSSIERFLGLTRQKLIQLALLVGCDYTVGVNNVGVVSAVEILSEFSAHDDQDIAILKKFKSWWEERQTIKKPPGNPILGRLANLDCHFPPSFPDALVFKAFTTPNVDVIPTKTLSMEWSSPDVEGLRRFASLTFGWSREKVDDILLPAVRRFVQSLTNKQTSIRNFAFSLHSEADTGQLTQTNRVQNAIRKLKDVEPSKRLATSRGKVVQDESAEIRQDEIPAKNRRKQVQNGSKEGEPDEEIHTKSQRKVVQKETDTAKSRCSTKVRKLPNRRKGRKSKRLAAKTVTGDADEMSALSDSD